MDADMGTELSLPPATFKGALANLGKAAYEFTAKLAGYKAAYVTNTTTVGSRYGTNPNSIIAETQRRSMIFTAEAVYKNDPLAAAYVGLRQNYCSSSMEYFPATGDPRLDAEIKAYLHGYDGHSGVFATMGADCSMQAAFTRTADLELPMRGDSGMVFWRDEFGELKLIEWSADQLGEIYDYSEGRTCSLTIRDDGSYAETGGNDCVYFAGRYMRGASCVAYKIYERVGSWYGNARIYPARDVLYFRDPSGPRGLRGVTFFANVMQYLQKAEDMMQAALSAAQRQARIYGRVKNNSGSPENEPSYTVNDCGRVTFFSQVPNGPMEEYYYPGDDAEFTAPTSPGGDVIAGHEASAELIALGLRVNYAFLCSPKNVGGAPSRLEIEKVTKEFLRIQNEIHRPHLRRIVNAVLLDAMRRGKINPRGSSATFLNGTWQLPVAPSVDAGYSHDENITNLRSGLESPQMICAEMNVNWEQVLQQKAEAAFQVAKMVDATNKRLTALGIEPTVSAFDVMQLSDNPQQFAEADALADGKPDAVVKKETATA